MFASIEGVHVSDPSIALNYSMKHIYMLSISMPIYRVGLTANCRVDFSRCVVAGTTELHLKIYELF